MSTESGMVLVPRAELHSIFKAVEALKRPCGWDPEEPQAERNGVYATIARRLWDLLATTHSSPPTPAVDGWQPIETALRDRAILVAAGDLQCVAYHDQYDWVPCDAGYVEESGNRYVLEWKPTHWMPRPRSPK